MSTVPLGLPSWERTMEAVDKVRDRLLRATAALQKAGVPYAVVGGNAVATWVGRVDAAAVRFTQDVDLLLRRCDLEAAKLAMASAGFVYRHARSVDMFLDGPDARARDAVHIVFAGEKVHADYVLPTPEMSECEQTESFHVLKLEPLVRMKLTSFRDKDRTHLRDMLDVGLIDSTWPARLPAELGERLQSLIDNPEG
jgi:hypothetical protein